MGSSHQGWLWGLLQAVAELTGGIWGGEQGPSQHRQGSLFRCCQPCLPGSCLTGSSVAGVPSLGAALSASQAGPDVWTDKADPHIFMIMALQGGRGQANPFQVPSPGLLGQKDSSLGPQGSLAVLHKSLASATQSFSHTPCLSPSFPCPGLTPNPEGLLLQVGSALPITCTCTPSTM